jgi:iron(III) transport system substrate-binding protein
MVNLLYVFVVSVLFSLAASAFAQDAKLLEAAKKDGKVVIYGSLESDTVEAITKAFQKKTGLEVDYWRASATKVMDRALTEYRAGKPLFDII